MTRKYKKNRKSHPLSEEHKRKISDSLKGKHISPSTEFKKNHTRGMLGKQHTKVTKLKMSRTRRTIISSLPSYKGGINKLLRRMYHTSWYRKWRDAVYKRDNYACQKCDNDLPIEAHHKVPFSELFNQYNIQTFEEAIECDALWDICNGITLCIDCHNLTKQGNPVWRNSGGQNENQILIPQAGRRI